MADMDVRGKPFAMQTNTPSGSRLYGTSMSSANSRKCIPTAQGTSQKTVRHPTHWPRR